MSPQLLLLAADGVTLSVGGGGSSAVKLFLLVTALSFASALLISITCFTRVVIVLSFLRQALGTQQLPPTQVLMALALAITGLVMAPTATRAYEDGVAPYLEDRLGHAEAFEAASRPVRAFLLRQTRPDDLATFQELSGGAGPEDVSQVSLAVLIPAFLVSELSTAFRMGLFLFIPMVIVDLLVASILMSLGMQMVPPTLVALPVKLAVFLLADGWRLVVVSLVRSFS